ncbi:MAG TPA: hypothetical protein V6C97_27460 [Oculatellaceae cyanobacterium]
MSHKRPRELEEPYRGRKGARADTESDDSYDEGAFETCDETKDDPARTRFRQKFGAIIIDLTRGTPTKLTVLTTNAVYVASNAFFRLICFNPVGPMVRGIEQDFGTTIPKRVAVLSETALGNGSDICDYLQGSVCHF